MIDLKFTLDDGREIFLEAFFEFKTYGGLLLGKASELVNRDVLNSHSDAVEKLWPEEPHLILGLEHYETNMAKELPSVACAGQFLSYEPARDPNRGGSCLVVIWFQDQMFPLLAGENSSWLKSVVWNKFAKDFDW